LAGLLVFSQNFHRLSYCSHVHSSRFPPTFFTASDARNIPYPKDDTRNFKQDSAPPLFVSEFRDYLDAAFPGTFFGRAEPIAWCQISQILQLKFQSPEVHEGGDIGSPVTHIPSRAASLRHRGGEKRWEGYAVEITASN
jgi:hypothetical protein